MTRARIISFIICSFFVLTACSDQDTRPIPSDDIYRPPTQIPTLNPTVPRPGNSGSPYQPVNEKEPTPTPSCLDGLLFLEDLTIPDGTLVEPGESLDKRWKVQNNGSCNWGESYRVKLIAGPGMGVPVQQALNPALSGTEVIVRMIFIAPDEPGNYRSAWQAYDPFDNPFGDPFFIDIVVAETADQSGGE